MSKVTFDEKQNTQTNENIPRINKVIDDDINQLKKGVNEGGKYNMCTFGSDASYSCNLQGILEAGDIINVFIPFSNENESSIDNIRLSIDNGITFYNIREMNSPKNLLAKDFLYKDKCLSLFFDGDIFRLTTDLLSEISCGITEDITKTTTTQGICPLEVNASIGNKLSVVGDEIIVGPGVSFVEISGSMLGHADTDTPTSTQAYIKHNGNSIATGRDLATTTDKYTYVALPTFLFPVNEGDKITLTWWKSNTTNFTIKKGSATQITVKAIA